MQSGRGWDVDGEHEEDLAAALLEGKAREEQPGRPAASTCVIAEPGVLYSAGAKTLSLPFNPPSPTLIIGAWLSASCFSEGHFFVLHVIHTSLSSLLHFCHHTSFLSLCHTSSAPDNTSASLQNPQTLSP